MTNERPARQPTSSPASDTPRRTSPGRPPLYEEPRSMLSLRLTDALLDAIDQEIGPEGNRTAAIERMLRTVLGLPPLSDR